MALKISVYEIFWDYAVKDFLKKAFTQDNRQFQLSTKDNDLNDINVNYMRKGCFWCLRDNKNNIHGTIALRELYDCWEIRRFFVEKKFQGKGYGKKLLKTAIQYALQNNAKIVKAATLKRSQVVHNLFSNTGFVNTNRYIKSSGEIFYKLELTTERRYKTLLKGLKQQFTKTLILNPTENLPVRNLSINTAFMEGIYVDEHVKNLNDKIIFAGRSKFIEFIEEIKKEWSKTLGAYEVDLKTLSGLHAHMVLFMCILQPGDSVMLLPEICGGHFSTEAILKNIGAQVIQMCPDIDNQCVDRQKTEILIEQKKPRFIFVDRSEGLIYEDFSWLNRFEYCYKIFDASQYLSQILIGEYQHPFSMGFDMLISTLHKNYPGPQKGLICVMRDSSVWQTYLANAKTYISNTHPRDIANSLIPQLDNNSFQLYAHLNIVCIRLLEKELLAHNVPVVQSSRPEPKTMHIWILGKTQLDNYNYFIKLEKLGLLTNYRLLPYNLGHGLRIGTGAAVRSGLKAEHINFLADIMSRAYHRDITSNLIKDSSKLINKIKGSIA